MLHTYLTDTLGLRYPIIGAPMAGVAGGKLAGAISRAGGLGMIGIGSETAVTFLDSEANIARADGDGVFGIGLMLWAVERRPELLDAAIAACPTVLSLSFGDVAPYAERVHNHGILIATQVNSIEDARAAEAAGADLIVAQGTEAGGHTGQVGTLPLLQMVLETVRTPVVAAGGIASARGLAAVLAAGAAGAWMGTAFLASPEGAGGDQARSKVTAARETETVLTHVFDRVQGTAWPPRYPGRALRNRFSDAWHRRADEVARNAEATETYRAAREARNYDTAVIYAGQAVGLVERVRPAEEVVHAVGEGAEALLRRRADTLLSG
jgi:nitronate monooxygenase